MSIPAEDTTTILVLCVGYKDTSMTYPFIGDYWQKKDAAASRSRRCASSKIIGTATEFKPSIKSPFKTAGKRHERGPRTFIRMDTTAVSARTADPESGQLSL